MTISVTVPADVAGSTAPAPSEQGQANDSPTAGQGEQPGQSARPGWLPAKFATPEELAQAYTELEGRAEAPTPQPSEQQAAHQLQSAGLDLNSFQEEYAAKGGKLSEESYTKLEQAGFSRQIVNDYIRGQEAIAQQETAAVFAEVGGEAEFQKLASWARSNLPTGELQAFNQVVDTAPIDVIRLAVAGLHAKYTAANGQEPRLVTGHFAGGVQGFASRYEMVEAMRNPRYKQDEAYRAEVTRKVAASNIF